MAELLSVAFSAKAEFQDRWGDFRYELKAVLRLSVLLVVILSTIRLANNCYPCISGHARINE